MATAFSGTGNFVQGRLGQAGRVLLHFSESQLVRERIEHSFFLIWDNGRITQRTKAPWTAVHMCATSWPRVEFLAIAKDGRVLEMRRDGSTREFNLWTETGIVPQGSVRWTHRIGDRICVVGSNCQVIELSYDLSVADRSVPGSSVRGQSDIGGFEAIDGYSSSEVYACGLGGKIWYCDGQIWREVDTPTRLFLSAIHCAPDGYVYVAGQDGTLLRGRETDWELIQHSVRDYFWSLSWFHNELYACSLQKLYVLRDGDLHELDLPHNPGTFFTLDANDHALLSVGSNDVLLLRANEVVKVV